jgi:hypothetical protein
MIGIQNPTPCIKVGPYRIFVASNFEAEVTTEIFLR